MNQLQKPTSALEYYGTHAELGWLKLRESSGAVFGVGTLHPIRSDDAASATESKGAGRLVYCAKSGQLFRFIGALLPTPKALAMQVLAALVAKASKADVLPVAMDAPAAPSARSSAPEWFDSELVRIKAMRSAGLDPYVGMRFLVRYLGESRPSLSRKFGTGLVKPVKRGGRNFWLLSQADAYATGQAKL